MGRKFGSKESNQGTYHVWQREQSWKSLFIPTRGSSKLVITRSELCPLSARQLSTLSTTYSPLTLLVFYCFALYY